MDFARNYSTCNYFHRFLCTDHDTRHDVFSFVFCFLFLFLFVCLFVFVCFIFFQIASCPYQSRSKWTVQLFIQLQFYALNLFWISMQVIQLTQRSKPSMSMVSQDTREEISGLLGCQATNNSPALPARYVLALL